MNGVPLIPTKIELTRTVSAKQENDESIQQTVLELELPGLTIYCELILAINRFKGELGELEFYFSPSASTKFLGGLGSF